MGKWFFILLLFAQASAQILEKKGMMQIGAINSFSEIFNIATLWKIATNWYIIVGILFSIVGILLWLSLLSNVNLSYISPFSALLFVVIALLGWLLLGEHISVIRWAGIIVITIGCILINIPAAEG